MEQITETTRKTRTGKEIKINGHKIILGDCINILKDIPDKSIQLIFTDPPYNISQTKFGTIKFKMEKDEYLLWTRDWINQCYRVLADNGSIYIMGHPRFIPYIMPILDDRFYFINQIIYYYTDGMPEKKCFAKRYECILYYRKDRDNFIFNLDDIRVDAIRYDKHSHPIGKNPGDVWQIHRVRWNSKERISLPNGKIAHVSQKPIKLLKRIILASSNEGDTVLDPFLGTGTTSAAAVELNRNSIGIELDEQYFNICIERVKKIIKEKKEFNSNKIYDNIKNIEDRYKKIDEWFIPRDRDSYYLTNDFHPYFAAFPPQLVRKVMEKYSKKGELILDPFVGGGSAITEAKLLNRDSIGIDISPLAILISKVKSHPIKITESDISSFLSVIKDDLQKYKQLHYEEFIYEIPELTNIDKWFIKEVQFQLAIIKHHISCLQNENLRDFLLVGFSSIIRKVSNAKNAEQHLCIKKGKNIPDTFSIFSKKISLMKDQMQQYYDLTKSNNSMVKLYQFDTRKMKDIVKKESIDLIITSPPYGTGSRYSDIYRLSYGWLQFDKPEKDATLETAKDFKKELKVSLEQIYFVLKPNHYCCFVYGDPSSGELTRRAISDAINIGFKYEGLISCPLIKMKSKRGTKYRQFIPKDFILIFKKY